MSTPWSGVKVSQPGDPSEQEARRVADAVSAGRPMPDMGWTRSRATIQRCGPIAPENCPCHSGTHEPSAMLLGSSAPAGSGLQRTSCAVLARERDGSGSRSSGSILSSAGNASGDLGVGRPLPKGERLFFEERMGTDFSTVRVHEGKAAGRTAHALGARAFTLGDQIVFAPGERARGTVAGNRLLAHELAHVVQQRSYGGGVVVQKAPDPRSSLEVRPSRNGAPCACLVFLHNDEANARRLAENLHDHCRFNLAIIGAGQGRKIRVPGADSVDPNALFPADVQEECSRDEEACRTRVAGHNDRRAMEMQFFLAIKSCADNFELPTVALHNNIVTETAAFREAGLGHALAALMEDVRRDRKTGRGSRADLRRRLRRAGPGRRGFAGLMSQSGMTNIFRWCSLPEIGRCHIGDPSRPDNVIWVTNARDYARFERAKVNVVLQEDAETARDSESDKDLSTLFVRLGADARFINIETPHTTRDVLDDESVRLNNAIFVLRSLNLVGLNCCDNE